VGHLRSRRILHPRMDGLRRMGISRRHLITLRGGMRSLTSSH
jgi:hypothetical protein